MLGCAAPIAPIPSKNIRTPGCGSAAADRTCGLAALAAALALLVEVGCLPVLAASDGATNEWFDAAPFACVCTSDPQRTAGVRAGRLQEIAAEDLFLATDLVPEADGSWRVPRASDARACIGLHWNEGRPIRSLGVDFGPGFKAPTPAGAAVQIWTGATRWQGEWKPMEGSLDLEGNGWRFTPTHPGTLCQKVRWIIPAGSEAVLVRGLSALTTSRVTQTEITILRDPPGVDGEAEVETYNAQILEGGRTVLHRTWDRRKAMSLSVRHATVPAALEGKGDRGAIRFRGPAGGFAVAIEDVLQRGPVYVAHAGLFVFRSDAAVDPAEYRRGVALKKTILEEVRAMPDQTRERAMRVTHYNPGLDAGRLMLSLACDNAKFVTEADGSLHLYEDFTDDDRVGSPNYALVPIFGNRRILAQSQGWGRLGLNRAAHADPATALALKVHDRDYTHGLGHHAPGEIVVDVSEGYERFEAEVGLQWQGGGTPGSVVFEVFVDARRVFNSGVMRESDDPKALSVSLAGARTLTLRLGDAGDGIAYDAANWCDARLVRQGAAQYLADLFGPARKSVRRLEGGWLPAPVITTSNDGVEYRQRIYVVPFARENPPGASQWLNSKPLGVVELTLENKTGAAVDATASFAFSVSASPTNAPAFGTNGSRTTVSAGSRLLAVFDGAECPTGAWRLDGNRVRLAAHLPAGASGRCFIYLPAWFLPPEAQSELTGGPELFDRFKNYWEQVMAPGMQIELPDPWIADVIRANQVHVLIAARNEQQGRLVAPWIASDRYRFALDSEGNSVIRGMEYFGHFDFAQRAFEYFFKRYRPEGFMTTGYTLMGNGWHLWALGEYARLARPDVWFKSVAERPAGLCRWVMAQLEKTRRTRSSGDPVPEYGLMPPGVEADWNAYAYYFYANSYFLAGLEGTGRALDRAGHPDAARVLAAARQLRVDLVRAFKASQALAPVVPLRNGTWVPYYPGSVYTPGPMGDYYPGQDGNRSWAYDVELGSHHMPALGALPPSAPETGWMLDHMEDVQFLSEGWGGYPAARNQEAWFDMGGFAKVQPYYARNAEVYALRDDVKPFVRSYFNTLASLIDGTALSIFEHFSNYCYNKTHETGYFLHTSRTMLVTERGDDLWLAPFVTSNWFKNGMIIAVKNAPTFFGPIGYRIVSSASTGSIEAVIDPPARSKPHAIVLRLRHPEGKRIRSVTVNGGPHTVFDAEKETITFQPIEGATTVRAAY